MAVEPIPRFSFSFSDLGVPEAALRVLESSALPVPNGAEPVRPLPRPRWLPRLLPVFPAREPLLVELRSGAAPPFGARLVAGLSAIYAAAGAEAGVSVVAWVGGMAVGAHGVEAVPESPHAVLVAAALERQSVAAAAELVRSGPEGRTWLVLEGEVPAADAALGIDRLLRLLGRDRVVRLPVLGAGELRALASGGEPAMARRRAGLRHLDLAVRLVRAYLEVLP